MGSSQQDATEIKTHPFFKDVDWNRLEKKEIDPPFLPRIEKTNELNNFAKVKNFLFNFLEKTDF